MTFNQKLAVDLAEGVLEGRFEPATLPDWHWQLLLLASGVQCVRARPARVAREVLDHLRARTGYFADAGGDAPAAHMVLVAARYGQDARAAM
jgi:hypothetical protein